MRVRTIQGSPPQTPGVDSMPGKDGIRFYTLRNAPMGLPLSV
jgi:hypothetical protein